MEARAQGRTRCCRRAPFALTTEGEKSRLVAWADELRAVHARFRAALAVVRTALDAGCDPAAEADHELLLFLQSGQGGSYDAGS